MKIKGEAKEIKEVKEIEERSARAAAFFDLDGTLMPPPSLERRFFQALHYRREIPMKNYFLWLREAMRLLPRGICAIAHTNKAYLKGVQSFDESDTENHIDSPSHKSGPQVEAQASMHLPGRARRIPRLPVPRFFEDGVERVECHAMLGHAVVIVSGTLEPLGNAAARALETELAACGFATRIRVCATRLGERNGLWTGRVLDEAMFGQEKARALTRIVEEMGLDLSQCWGYGDTAADRWMLEAVGHPTAVNPTALLARIARTRGWPVLHWREERNLTQRRREHRDQKEDMREERATEPLLQSQEIQKPLAHAERCA